MSYFICKSIKRDTNGDIILQARCSNEYPSEYEPITLKNEDGTALIRLAKLCYYGDVQLLKGARAYGLGRKISDAIISACGDYYKRAWHNDDQKKEAEEVEHITAYILIH